MARYIDADALKDWSEIVPLTGDGGIDINDFDEKLASMPAADVAPVRHGKWITYDEFIDCSLCLHEKWSRVPYEELVRRFRYCPNCGAKMDGDFCQKSNYNQTKS